MTIVLIEGGLASQMWGYAAARRLALRHGAKVLIDPRNFRTYTKFQPELHHFDVDAVMLTPEQADEICGPRNEHVTLLTPRHLHFDRAVLDVPTAMLLMVGNFVSEDYFADVEEVIRKDFRRVTEPAPYAVEVREEIEAKRRQGYTPVALHVRRGDYVEEPETLRAHGTCTPEYYDNAVALVERLVEAPWYFVFSNDPDWTEAHASGERRTVTHPPRGTAPVEDMMLMAACDHHVLANSGYGWWSAWMADHPGQVVIGPRPFMADRSLNTEDILRRQWISLGTQPRP